VSVTSKQACRCLVALALLAPCAASAQTSTADGVRALIRGDDAAAVRILRPLAEDTPQPDPLALFFLATLYQSGRGVVHDDIRACGLYLKAATSPNPLLTQSLALARAIHRDEPLVRDLCTAASVGSWRDPPATSFTLGPDHWVRIDHEGFVVGYKGTQKRALMTMGGLGFVYLPVRHTQLEVSRPVATRRHFIEFFTWIPFPGQPWTLVWSLYEVVGADTLAVSSQGGFITTVLTTVAGAQPPESFAVEDVARIRVNADGEAEWGVSGANPLSGVIPYPEPR
jgi:hypothetical protein